VPIAERAAELDADEVAGQEQDAILSEGGGGCSGQEPRDRVCREPSSGLATRSNARTSQNRVEM
jgi:hypothetical protein